MMQKIRSVGPAARPSKAYYLRLLILSLIIFAAFGLRTYQLDGFSFWTDEALTPLRASYTIPEILSNKIIIQDGITNDTHPAFYYLIIHVTRLLLGETDFAYRYPSLLAGLLLVPLLFQLGRRLYNLPAGFAAAFLAAVNPLQIWYAHEARMYTIFVFLAAAATYLLWQAVRLYGPTSPPSNTGASRSLWAYLIFYFVVAGLALYTHYTAVFLIAAQSLFWAWLLWHNGQKKLLIGTAVLALLAAIPLIPFTIPRLFTGAEANYFYVPPLIMLQDVIHGFSLGVTTDFSLWSTRLLDIGAFLLVLVGVYAAPSGTNRAFLLVYLLAAVLGLMLGSLIKPMYQGVRHIMVSSPALLLLVAWATTYLWQQVQTRPSSSRSLAARSLVALVGTAVLLLGPALSLHNLYTNDRYAKDEFRGLVQFIDQHAGERDVVVYNNAILLPLHDHYQTRDGITVTASPIYPYPAHGVPDQLAVLSSQYDRLWFVTDPPADKRDEDGVAQQWLDTHLSVIASHLFPARTTEVRVIVYDTRPQTVQALSPNGRSLSHQWPSLPTLAGIHLDFTQPVTLPTLWLTLFWQGEQPPQPDNYLRFSLQGADGQEWLAHTTLLIPPKTEASLVANWPADLVRLNYALPLLPGTPPGTYTLWLQPFATVDGPPLGEARALIEIERGIQPMEIRQRPSLVFENGLALHHFDTPVEEVRPGHTLPLTLYWQAQEDNTFADVRYELEVFAPDGERLRTEIRPVGPSWLTTWPTGQLIREETGLYFSPETAPGKYDLRWRIFTAAETIPGRPSWRPWSTPTTIFGQVEVTPWPLVTDLPQEAALIEANFGDAIQLYGYELAPPNRDQLHLTLYWRALAAPDKNYTTFIHLVAPDSDEIVAQTGFIPVNGLRPTRGWRPSELLTDTYTLPLPPDLPPGTYPVRVGLYIPETGERPTVIYQDTPQPHNQLILTTITLP